MPLRHQHIHEGVGVLPDPDAEAAGELDPVAEVRPAPGGLRRAGRGRGGHQLLRGAEADAPRDPGVVGSGDLAPVQFALELERGNLVAQHRTGANDVQPFVVNGVLAVDERRVTAHRSSNNPSTMGFTSKSRT
jgi:hypothetical protein